MKRRARSLRKRQTESEQRLWHRLRNRQLAGFKFRRQHVIGPYIVDFVCLKGRLVVELDGGQHGIGMQRAYDQRRSASLARQGFRVIRFWNNDVLNDTEAVLTMVRRALRSPHPGPLPRGEGE